MHSSKNTFKKEEGSFRRVQMKRGSGHTELLLFFYFLGGRGGGGSEVRKKRPSHHQQAGAVTVTPLARLLLVTIGRGGGRGTGGGVGRGKLRG